MSHINTCAFTISNTPGSAGGFIVDAAVPGPYRAPRAGDDGKTFSLYVYEGSAWEVTSAVYTHSGTAFSRGTRQDSSSGSAIDFTSAAIVHVISGGADYFDQVDQQLARGCVIARNDGSTTQSLAPSTFSLLTVINSEERDPLGWWNGSRFQPNRAGIFDIKGGSQLTFSASALQSYMLVARKNGSDYAALSRGWIDGGGNVGVSGTCDVYLNGSTDYIELFGWHNGSSSFSTVAGAERQFFMASFKAPA